MPDCEIKLAKVQETSEAAQEAQENVQAVTDDLDATRKEYEAEYKEWDTQHTSHVSENDTLTQEMDELDLDGSERDCSSHESARDEALDALNALTEQVSAAEVAEEAAWLEFLRAGSDWATSSGQLMYLEDLRDGIEDTIAELEGAARDDESDPALEEQRQALEDLNQDIAELQAIVDEDAHATEDLYQNWEPLHETLEELQADHADAYDTYLDASDVYERCQSQADAFARHDEIVARLEVLADLMEETAKARDTALENAASYRVGGAEYERQMEEAREQLNAASVASTDALTDAYGHGCYD